MTTWTRVTDPDAASALLPAWFAPRMMGARGSYGFLLASGNVVRASRVTAVHMSSAGTVLIDVLLDHAGVPDGVDAAWRPKHYLGAPVPGASVATLNLAQVAMAIEFTAAEIAETQDTAGATASEVIHTDPSVVDDAAVANDTERAA